MRHTDIIEVEINDLQESRLLREIVRELRQIKWELRSQRKKQNDGIQLGIPNQKGETKLGQPVTLTVGAGSVQPVVVETLQGQPSATFNGPLAFASDNPAVATMDPASGLTTPVSAGTANCTVTDAIGNLTDTVVVTVVAAAPPPPTPNDGIQMTIPAQSPVLTASAHAALKK